MTELKITKEQKLTIQFQNENLVTILGEDVIASVPDLITVKVNAFLLLQTDSATLHFVESAVMRFFTTGSSPKEIELEMFGIIFIYLLQANDAVVATRQSHLAYLENIHGIAT